VLFRSLDLARQSLPGGAGDAAEPVGGATSPEPRVVVVRMLAQRVEPVFDAWRAIRLAWRQHLWQLSAAEPRIWRL
jgi:urease accessory protein